MYSVDEDSFISMSSSEKTFVKRKAESKKKVPGASEKYIVKLSSSQ